jgi:hypothetical protein
MKKPRFFKFKKFFYGTPQWAKYVWYSLKVIKSPKIGDQVTHKGEDCILIQGVQNPYWDLLPTRKDNLDKPKREVYKSVHEDDYQLQPMWRRFKFSFMSRYRWYMMNHFDSAVMKRVYGY